MAAESKMPVPAELDEDGMVEHYDRLHMEDDDAGDASRMSAEPGVLSRDQQHQSAYYDYASEKSLSHADAKLFYQSHQKELQESEDGLRLSGDLNNDFSATPGAAVAEASASHPGNLARSFSRVSSKPGLDMHFGHGPAAGIQDYNASATHDPQGVRPVDPRLAQAIAGGASGSMPGSIPGDMQTQDPAVTAELAAIYTSIREILELRRRFLGLSLQGEHDNPKDSNNWIIYPQPPEPVWNDDSNFMSPTGSSMRLQEQSLQDALHETPRSSISGLKGNNLCRTSTRTRKPGQDIGEDFDMEDLLPLPPCSNFEFEVDGSGVYQVFAPSKTSSRTPIVDIPTIRDYYVALDRVLQISSDGPTKSFAFRRLQYLEGKYNLYFLLNEYQEMADTKRVPHRDFYNVRKVDTHVHHSSCMNQKHLLRFIKSKMKKYPDEVVLDRDGKLLTLREVFESINLTAYDLSIDTLDMHVSLSLHPL